MRIPRGFLAALLLAAPALANAGDRPQPLPLADNPKLAYPEDARRFGITGEVSFTADVDERGQVTKVDVGSVPAKNVGFEESVKKAVSSWRFAPAVIDGKPARATYAATINFRLRPRDEADVTKMVEQLAAAWNARKVDAVLQQFDLAAVPATARGRNGMREEAELRTWLAEQMAAAPAPLKPAPRVLRLSGPGRAYVEVPLEAAAGAPPAAPLFGMMVKRNDAWKLVRLDWSEAPGQRPLRAGPGNIKEPRKVRHVDPEYPASIVDAGVQGVVVLECSVDPEGAVSDVQVVTGHPSLVKLAQDAVKKWRYTPTLFDGMPVPVIMTVTVNFHRR